MNGSGVAVSDRPSLKSSQADKYARKINLLNINEAPVEEETTPPWAAELLTAKAWTNVPGSHYWQREGQGAVPWKTALSVSMERIPAKPGVKTTEFFITAGVSLALVPGALWGDLIGILMDLSPSYAKLINAGSAIGLAVLMSWYAKHRESRKSAGAT